MTTQSKSLRLADRLANEPYAWPGGYPLFGVLDDGAPLCHECARDERHQIGTTTGTDGWCLQTIATNYEDEQLYCAHCSARIKPAYGALD